MSKQYTIAAISLAVAGVFGVSHADSANVVIYGQMNTGIEVSDTGTGSSTKMIDAVSRLGFKGTDDFGNGTKGVWQVESRVNSDGDTAGNMADREVHIGLTSESWGTLKMGHAEIPYWVHTLPALTWSGESDQKNAKAYKKFAGNMLWYTSPKLNGFTGTVAAIIGEDTDHSMGVAGKLQYNTGGLTVGYGFVRLNDAKGIKAAPSVALDNLAGASRRADQFAVIYKFGNTTVQGAYEITDANGKDNKQNAIGLGVQHDIDKLSLRFEYDQISDKKSSGTNERRRHMMFGVGYAVTKRTSFVAYLANDRESKNADDVNTLGVQIRHSF